MKLADYSETGPMCRFEDAHIFYVMTKLDRYETVSRSELSENTGIGEGSVRKIIQILKSWKAVEVVRQGVRISEEGCALLESIPMTLMDIGRTEYALGSYQRAVLVRNIAHLITDGMRQRDKGLIAGAKGASVFVMRDDTLIMPKSWNMDARNSVFAKGLRDKGMVEGDVIIICGSDDNADKAAISAISVALDLL